MEANIFLSAFLKFLKNKTQNLTLIPFCGFFFPFFHPHPPPWHTLFSSKIKNEDGLFKTDNSNGPSCNVLLNLSSVNYVVERNLPA